MKTKANRPKRPTAPSPQPPPGLTPAERAQWLREVGQAIAEGFAEGAGVPLPGRPPTKHDG